MPEDKFEIKKSYLIFCEGTDDEKFLKGLLKTLQAEDKIQTYKYGGKDSLPKRLEILRGVSGFENVSAILITRDADLNPQGAVSSIKSALAKNNYPVPDSSNVWLSENNIATGIIVFPDCVAQSRKGALETLCLSLIKDNRAEEIRNDIEIFLKEQGKKYGKSYTNIDKNRLHTYFSADSKYVTDKLGEAADAGAFDWNSPILKPLKEFILEGLQYTE